jgi:hypothetical protein
MIHRKLLYIRMFHYSNACDRISNTGTLQFGLREANSTDDSTLAVYKDSTLQLRECHIGTS